jgi:hypothetical protein
MLRYVYGQDRLVADAVAQLIPHVGPGGFGDAAKTIGVIDEEGRLIAGLVYHNYDPQAGTIEISGAATNSRWLSRETIKRMYQYPFHTCGCQMIAQRTPADSERLLGQLAEYGYTFIKFPRLFGRHRDGVICTLTYEDWCDNRFNKKFKHHLRDAPQEEAA